MDGVGSTVLFGVVMFLLLGMAVGIQIWRTRRAPLGKVVSILSSIRYNQKLCANFSYHRSVGRMKAKAWEKHRDRVTFLPDELYDELSKLFDKVAEINENIDAAIKHQSDSYMSAVDVDRLEAPLETCREQLQAWIYENMNNPAYLPKKRSLFQRW